MADALYLTAAHYANIAPYCPDKGIINCTKVTTSVFSMIDGVPIALLGLTWFALMAALALFRVDDALTNIWSMLGGAGVIYSTTGMWILKAICIWCTVMDILIVATLLLILFRRNRIFVKG